MLGSDVGEVAVIADLEAGLATMARIDPSQLDVVVVVVSPDPKSIGVGERAAAMATAKGCGEVIVVANRVGSDSDLAVVREAFGDRPVVVVPQDQVIADADRDGRSPLATPASETEKDPAPPGSPGVQALVELGSRLAARWTSPA